MAALRARQSVTALCPQTEGDNSMETPTWWLKGSPTWVDTHGWEPSWLCALTQVSLQEFF